MLMRTIRNIVLAIVVTSVAVALLFFFGFLNFPWVKILVGTFVTFGVWRGFTKYTKGILRLAIHVVFSIAFLAFLGKMLYQDVANLYGTYFGETTEQRLEEAVRKDIDRAAELSAKNGFVDADREYNRNVNLIKEQLAYDDSVKIAEWRHSLSLQAFADSVLELQRSDSVIVAKTQRILAAIRKRPVEESSGNFHTADYRRPMDDQQPAVPGIGTVPIPGFGNVVVSPGVAPLPSTVGRVDTFRLQVGIRVPTFSAGPGTLDSLYPNKPFIAVSRLEDGSEKRFRIDKREVWTGWKPAGTIYCEAVEDSTVVVVKKVR